MDVTSAITSSVGAEPATPSHARETVWDRIAELVRHPVTVFRRNLDELPFDYPPSVLIYADLATFIISVASAGQRHSYFPTALPILAIAFLFFSLPLFFFTGVHPSPFALGLCGMVALALFLLQPVPADFAPFVLVLVVGEVAAIAPKRVSATLAAAAVAELVAFDAFGKVMWSLEGQRFQGLPMYTAGVLLGWMAGVMMQYQRRFLYQEREYQQARASQAADEERRRIAREVHDVIAHSLSITLLHLTAARHALQADRDVDDAVDALVDAERLGRQAMADIRRTVGLLDSRPSKLVPEPGVGEIADLVGDFVRAGLDLRHECVGDPAAVSAAVGLALYRIGQESLANVVKHAPGASTTVRMAVDAEEVTLTVDNTLPAGLPPNPGHGMGLTGMSQRAELLGGQIVAGPYDDGWSVRAKFPLAARSALMCGLLPGLLRGQNSQEYR